MSSSDSAPTQSVLLLGSGLCSPPLVQYLSRHGFALTVASRTLERAEENVRGLPHARAMQFTADGSEAATARLAELAAEHDAVVSLLPYAHHPWAAGVCIRARTPFCTASYVSDAMQAQHEAAVAAGVPLVNECGVDPGLDLASAQQVIDRVHADGGKVLEFFSICGGLPAPQANNNPFGYKLSWSPRGVLLAAGNSATYLERGEVRAAAGAALYSPPEVRADRMEERGIGDLEWYCNRDSVKFRDIHGVPECQTLIRGTFRYLGWCDMMSLFAARGVVEDREVPGLAGLTVREAALRTLGLDPAAAGASAASARAAVAAHLGVPAAHDTLARLEWLGYFDGELRVPDGGAVRSPLDLVGFLFDRRLQYAPGEQDMIAMRHTFVVERACGQRRDTVTSTLVDFGRQDRGEASSMSRTVGIPLAVATRAVLEGRLPGAGVMRPTDPAFYNLLLDEMAAEHEVAFAERELGTHVWVRAETKRGEARAGLSPAACAALLAQGFRVTVERSAQRGIPDAEYEAAGCAMAEAGAWRRSPLDAIVFGLKELPEGDQSPLPRRHVFFAHAFKGQLGWRDTLGRFTRGGGSLYDLEFLNDDDGRRVAAFGRPAGEVGAALGLLAWAARALGEDLNAGGPLAPWASFDAMVRDVRARVEAARASSGAAAPEVLVVGALGRSGRGAAAVAEACGLAPVCWDLEETKGGGPFQRMVECDVLVNCIYLPAGVRIPPFVTADMVRAAGRRLAVFVDVSADTTNPASPVPFYNEATTVDRPVLHLDCGADAPPLDIVAIDHLPTLLPAESTVAFSADLLPHLAGLADPAASGVWARAAKLFRDKAGEAAKKEE